MSSTEEDESGDFPLSSTYSSSFEKHPLISSPSFELEELDLHPSGLLEMNEEETQPDNPVFRSSIPADVEHSLLYDSIKNLRCRSSSLPGAFREIARALCFSTSDSKGFVLFKGPKEEFSSIFSQEKNTGIYGTMESLSEILSSFSSESQDVHFPFSFLFLLYLDLSQISLSPLSKSERETEKQ